MPILESYYDALAIARTADTDEIKKAFRKLSLKYHPERAVGITKAEAEVIFAKTTEAYEVLSNPARRAIYDQYGERGLKEGVPDGKGGLKGGKYRFNNNALEIFAAFFGTSSPFADILGQVGEDAPPSFYGELTGMQLPFSKEKAPPVKATLEVTLGEVYNGAMKTVSYTRKKLGDDGVTSDEAVETQLFVEPGWEAGLVATLPELGDQGVHVLPGDVEITMVVTPEPLWSREGTTLFYTETLTLTEALTGKVIDVPTFDSRMLSIPVTKIVAPGDSQVVPGEGINGGELVICFELVFPKTLTPAQKKAIKAVAM
jgi:DnaJ family protein B protein 13